MSIFSKNKQNGGEDGEKNLPLPEKTETEKTEEEAQGNPAPRSTPEGFNFNRYFLAERRIVLDNVSYEAGRIVPNQSGAVKLGVKDTIIAQLVAQAGVKVSYNRTLRFEPDGPFTLSVTFAVMLVFNPGTKDEVDWTKIDIAEEFKKNCPALAQTMAAKAALIAAELTAANSGTPIIPIR